MMNCTLSLKWHACRTDPSGSYFQQHTHSPGYSKTPVSEKTILIYLYICQLKSSASKQTITAVTAVENISVFVCVERDIDISV